MQPPSLKTLRIGKKVSNSGDNKIGYEGKGILRKMKKERNMDVYY